MSHAPRKFSRLLAILFAFTLLAAACGGDDGDGEGAGSEEGSGSEEAAGGDAAAPCDGNIDGPVTLTLTSHGSGDAYTGAVADFNAGPGTELGVTVELIDLGEAGYEDFIVAAAASGDLPDIIDMDGPFLYNFAWNGFVQPLGNCVPDGSLDDFLPSIISQGTYNGELYSLGAFDSGMGIWAKRSVLEANDIRIPETSEDAWTVDEFDTILRTLQDSGISSPLDIKWFYGAGEWRPYGFAPIIQSAGGDIINRSDFQSAEGALNGPEAVAAMTTFQTWAQDGLLDLEAVDDTPFIEGDVPLSWVGHWMYGAYKEALGDDLVLVPLPDFGTGSKAGMGSWNYAMATGDADPDAVWAFIEFVTSPEQVKIIADAESAVPALRSVLAADPTFQPGGDRYLYVLNLEAAPDIAFPRPATPAYGAIRDAFSDALADIVAGADVQETLDKAVAEIDADIAANDGYPTQ